MYKSSKQAHNGIVHNSSLLTLILNLIIQFIIRFLAQALS